MSLTEARLSAIELHLRRSEARLARENPESPRVKRHLKELNYWKDLTLEVRRLWALIRPELRDASDRLSLRAQETAEHARLMRVIHGGAKR